jgi:glycosyltransferase involved in cell wall biosynthesis
MHFGDNRHMRKVLFIANRFHPSPRVGARRLTKFAKFLPEYGWQPIVLTATTSQGEPSQDRGVYRLPALNLDRVYDWGRRIIPPRRWSPSTSTTSNAQTVSAKLPGGRSRILNRWLFIPDEHVFWALGAAWVGLRLAKANQVKAICSTAPPFSSHLAAWWIARCLHLPWVADFRDPWLANPDLIYPTSCHRWLNARLESAIIHAADCITNISPHMQQDFVSRYLDRSPDTFLTIYNGFDPDDFMGIRRERPQQKRVRILHNGTFSGSRTPVPFLESLVQLRDNRLLEDIEVYFVGASQHVIHTLIDVFALTPLVTILEYMPHRQSLQHLLDADLLLLVSSGDAMTSKVFEYLAVQKPILAVVDPQGAAAQLIKEAKAGIVVDHHSPAAIADGLVRLIQSIRAGNAPSAEPEFVAQFDYKVLTRQLARCFDEICGY